MSVSYLSCAHTHTHYCDGKDAPEVLIQKALELGFVSLGFSGHGCAPHDSVGMLWENELKYRAELRQLQRDYADRIEVLLGVEHDYWGAYPDYAYDYMIESVHYIKAKGVLHGVDWTVDRTETAIREGFDGDAYAYCREYFRTCAAAYEKTPAQIAGHLDLVTKFNEQLPVIDESDPRYLGPAMEALECAVSRGLVVEVNTGAMAKGYRTVPYPNPALLKRLRELNGQVMINSDCHSAPMLNCGYAEATALLQTCGFDHAVILRKTGFQEVPL